MIWSLVKVLLFIAAIAALALGASLLTDIDSGMRIAVAGYEFTLGPLQAVIAALVLVAFVWVLIRVIALIVATLRFLNGDETAISRYFDRNRERKGYQALSESLIALASGEGRLALSRATKAEKYLARPELTTLIAAQAAEMAGDGRRATEAYKTLLTDEKTRFVGVRGLMLQKMAEGDAQTALKLAEKAIALKPKHPEMQDTLLRLQAEASDWKGARATLGTKLKTGTLPRDVYRRRDAVLALQEARTIIDDTSSVEAREAAIEANRLSPDLIPAAAMAARGLAMKGEAKAAARVLKKAWEVQPHPDLAAAFADIEPEESPTQRLKRFKLITAIRPDDPETRMLLTELNLAAEDFPAARRALGDLATAQPTHRSVALMAAIERGEGADEATVRGWMARAMSAPRGPQWCCDKCQAIHANWAPICDNCGGFDTLSWRPPTEGYGPSSTGAELLPLLVGTPKPPEPTETLIEEIDDIIDGEALGRAAN
jgi:HemY protein